MNKIFKVLWNRARATRVVTDETKTSCGKGRQGATTLARSSLGVLAAAAIAAFGTLADVLPARASEITPAAGWSHTSVKNNAGRYDISTDKFINANKTGINHFEKFNLSAGNIANLHFDNGNISADRLVNFVNQKINVDGTLNAVKNGKVGGDLIFVSPLGMAVGTTGVINAGSLTAVAPKKGTYEEWVNYLGKDMELEGTFNDAFWTNLESGNVPLNPDAVITVAGSINAGNRIALAASNVFIEQGAQLKTGIDDFASLVNITDESGAVSVSSGLAESELGFTVDESSGDIILFARADETFSDDADIPDAGDGTPLTADIHASVSVAEGASVSAKKDVVIRAEAGNAEYDTVNKAWVESDALDTHAVAAGVVINGAVTAGGDIDAQAYAHNWVDHSFGFNLQTIAEQVTGGWMGALAQSTFEYVDMAADAVLKVGSSAVLTAGSDIRLDAASILNLKVGDTTAWKGYYNPLPDSSSQYIPVVAAAVGLAEASSSVTVEGTLLAGEDVRVRATTAFDADLGTIATVQKTDSAQASFVYADFDSSSEVTIAESAEIGAVEGKTQLANVEISADTINRVETSAETYVSSAGSVALAVNVTEFDSNSEVNMLSGIDVPANSISIASSNTAETIDILSRTTVGDNGILQKIQNKVSDLVFGQIAAFAGEHGHNVDGTVTTDSFNGGGAIAVLVNSQSSKTLIDAGDEELNALNELSLSSNTTIEDHHYEATTKAVIDESTGNTQTDKQGALAVLVASNSSGRDTASSELVIADESTLSAENGSVSLSSTVDITKDRAEFLVNQLNEAWDMFAAYFEDEAYEEELAEFEAQKKQMTTAFEAVTKGSDSLENFKQLIDAMADFASFLSATFGVAGEAAGGIAEGALEIGYSILDIVSPARWTNAYVSAGGVTSKAQDTVLSVSGSVAVVNQTATNAVTIGRGTSITAGGDISIAADSANENIVMGGFLDNFFGVPLPTRDNAKALGASVAYQGLSTNNSLVVKEGVALTAGLKPTDAAAGDISLVASDALDAVAIAGAAGANGGGTSFSGLVAVTNAEGSNNLQVDDEANFQAQNDLAIQALRNDSLQTIAGSLGVTTGEDGGAVAVGVGLAVNLGGVENLLEIKDNDGASSIFGVGPGTFAAGNSLTVAAETTVNANAIGVAGQVASSSDKEADDQLGALGEGEGMFGDGADSTASIIEQLSGSAAVQNSGFSADMDWLMAGSNDSASSLPKVPQRANPQDISDRSTNVAGAGSIAWNQFDQTNSVVVGTSWQTGDIRFEANHVAVEAVTDKWVGAFSGAAAISAMMGSKTSTNGKNVGVGGAVAVNASDFINSVKIDGLVTTAETMTVQSLVNGTTVAEGLGLAVAAGQSQTAVGIDAGISANIVKNTVSADVSGLVNESDDDTEGFVYDQTAWSGETQVTGGTGFGVAAGGSSFSGAFGASIAVAKIDNKISSTLKDSTITDADDVSVRALASLTQVNTAVGANVGVSSGGSSAAITGSVLYAGINNLVSAEASNTSITTRDGGAVEIAARTAGTGDGQEAQALAQRAQGVEGVFTRDELLGRDAIQGVTLSKDQNGSETVDVKGEFVDDASMTQVSVAVGVAAAAGSGGSDSAGSAAVLVSDLDNVFTASSSSLTVSSAAGKGVAFNQTAATDVSTVNVAAGVAASTGGNFNLGVAGSVIVSGIEQTANSTAQNLKLSAAGLDGDAVQSAVTASNTANTVNVAGNASVAIGTAGAGVGAAVAVTGTENNANALVTGADTQIDGLGSGVFAVTAQNAAETWAAAVNAAVSANAAIGGSFVLNRLANNASAHIADSSLTGLEQLLVSATDDSAAWTLSGGASVALQPGAAASGGIAVASSSGTTSALVENTSINAGTSETDVTIEAEANDKIMTMTLGAAVGASPGVAVTAATAKNDINRTVSALLDTFKGGSDDFGNLTVKADSNASVGNLGIMAAASETAGVGIGIALNSIDIDVAAQVVDTQIAADTIHVASKSANDIDTIAVGGAAAGVAGVNGSVAVNNISGDVTAAVLTESDRNSTKLTYFGAMAVNAQSDDAVGTYAGQVAAGGTAAVGLSVGVTNHDVNTTAKVDGGSVEIRSEKKNNQISDSTIAIQGGVADEYINSDVAPSESISTADSLEDDRSDKTVGGFALYATSTTTYKTLVINGGGAGTAEVAGSASAVSHGGTTTALWNNGYFEDALDKSMEIFAGDYANFFTSLNTAGGAATAAANVGVSLVDTSHATKAWVTAMRNGNPSGRSVDIYGGDIRIASEAKEGVSALTITASGSGVVAAGAAAAVTNLGSSVETIVEATDMHIDADTTYEQDAHYLGRISNLGVTAAGSGAAAGAVNVALNTTSNRVATILRKMDGGGPNDELDFTVEDGISITASRDTDIKQYSASVAGAQFGGASAFVAVNEIGGETETSVDTARFQENNGTEEVTISAVNNDRLDILNIGAAGAEYVGAGVGVVVNKIHDAANVNITDTLLYADQTTILAEQNRTLNGTMVTVGGALIAGLGVNVVATEIGESTDNYSSILGEAFAGAEEDDPTKKINEYQEEYGGYTPNDIYKLANETAGGNNNPLVSETIPEGSGPAALTGLTGTHVELAGVTIDAGYTPDAVKYPLEQPESVTIIAREDAAEGSGVDLTLGSGTAGAVSLAASVATLKRHNDVGVTLGVTESGAGNSIRGKNVNIGASLNSDDSILLWQAAVGLLNGTAAYAESTADGGVKVAVSGTTIKAEQTDTDKIGYTQAVVEDNRTTEIDVNGITAAAVAAGAMIGKISDSTNAQMSFENSSFLGNASLLVDRAPSLVVHALAGYGGAVTGVGASASIADSGSAEISLENVTAEDSVWKTIGGAEMETSTFEADVRLHPEIAVSAEGKGGAAVAVGVVEATASASGHASIDVANGSFTTRYVNFGASAGRNTDSAADALRMSADIESYGGAAVGVRVNTAKVVNDASSKITMRGAGFSSTSDVTVDSEAYADYSLTADAASGGVITSDNSLVTLKHSADAEAVLEAGTEAVQTKSLDVIAQSAENAVVKAASAGGSVITVNAKAVDIEHTDESNAKVSVAGAWQSAGDMSFASATNRVVSIKGDNTIGTVAGGGGAGITNTTSGETSVTVADNASLTAGGLLDLTADTKWTVRSADEGEDAFALESGVYGAVAGNDISIKNTQTTTTKVAVGGNAKLESAGAMTLSAKTTAQTALRVQSLVAGAVTGVGASAAHTINTTNAVSVGDGTSLKTSLSSGDLTLSASSDETHALSAIGNVQGAAAGGSTATLTLDYSRTNTVDVGSNASLWSARDVNLYAGRGTGGEDAKLDLLTYTHAYSHSFIAPVTSEITDNYTYVNTVGVGKGASVISTADINAAAHLGDLSTRSEARYYNWTSKKDSGSVEIATTEFGTVAGSAQQTNAVTVDGTLLAGVNTKADITIEGIVYSAEGVKDEDGNSYVLKPTNPNASTEPTITVSAGDEASREEIASKISQGVDESGNSYWDRYLELERLIAEYGSLEEKDGSVLAVYKAEHQALIDIMIRKGLAEYDDSDNLVVAQSTQRPYVMVDGVAISGGNIAFTTDSVTGSGSVTAQAAEGITITNNSNLALKVGDVEILQKGGSATLNGVVLMPGQANEGFDVANLSTAEAAASPTINISSNFEGSVEYLNTTTNQSTSVVPDTSVILTGRIVNVAGDVNVSSSSDLFQLSGSTVSAAGSASLTAAGNVMQFYTTGIHNIGGDVESQWAGEKETIDNAIKDGTVESTYTWEEAPEKTAGGIIAGGDVIISGQMVNINGTVQSGYSSYELDLDAQQLQSAIDTIVSNWKANGSKTYINVKSPEFQLTAGGEKANGDGTYSYQVASWYDPVSGRIVVDDIVPEGGHIYISGAIASTGSGNIVAAQGHADISIDAGTYDVLTGVVDTGNVDGLIRITDTNFADANYSAKVTEWTSAGGKSWMLDQSGNKVGAETAVNIANGYNPESGLLYSWTWGYQTGTTTLATTNQGFTWWGAYDWDRPTGEPDQSIKTEPLDLENEPMLSGATISTDTARPSGTGDFEAVAEVIKTDEVEGQWNWTYWTEYNDALHWGGTNYAEGTKTDSAKNIVVFTVKADKNIGTKFIEGSNTINIRTEGSLLLGGNVTAENGTVGLSAGKDILNESFNAAVTGASNLTMTAGGSIGSSTSAINLRGGTGTLNAAVTAGKDVYLDGTALTSQTVAGSFKAGGTLELSAMNDINASFEGTNIALSSTLGAITADVNQLAAADSTQRFDAQAYKSITVTADKGDLGLGQVKSHTGDVAITVANGSVFDALDRASEEAMTADERISLWKQLGIIGENGESTGQELWEADLAKAESALRNDYDRYKDYKNIDPEILTDEQEADFAKLTERFGSYESVEKAVDAEKANAETDLGSIYAAQDSYGWTQDQLMYAIAEAIANPDAGYTPVAGEANVSGQNVVINTAAGSMGINAEAVTGEIDIDMLKLLAQADVDDVTWHADGTVTVQLKKPVTVEASQKVSLDARDDIFVQSTDDTSLGVAHAVAQNGALRLTSAQGIYGVYDEAYKTSGYMSGATVTLRGGEGGLGTSEAAISLHHADDGWTALSSVGDIYVDADGESLTLYAVSGGGSVTINAANVYSYSGESVDFGDDQIDFSTLGYIAAGDEGALNFNVTGDFGEADNALRVASNASLVFNGTQGNVWLSTVGDQGTLTLTGINASGVVDVETAAGINAAGISAGSLALHAEGDILVSADASGTNGAAFTTNEGSFTANSGVKLESAQGDLTISAQAAAATLSGATLSAGQKLSVSAASIAADNAIFSSDGNLEMTAADISAQGMQAETVGGDALIAAQAGAIDLANAFISAQGKTTLAAASGATLTGAALTGSVVELSTEVGDVSAQGATLTATDGAVTVSAAANADLAGATVNAASVDIAAGEGLTGDGAQITATSGNLSLDSEAASLSLIGSKLAAATGDVALTAAQEIAFAGEDETAEKSEVTAQNISIDAGAAADLSAGVYTAENALQVTSVGDLTADGAQLKAGAGGVTLQSTSGAVSAAGAEMLANTEGNEGSVTVSAATDAALAQATISAASVGIAAGANLTGDGAQITATSGDISLDSETASLSLIGSTLAATAGDVALKAAQDIAFAGEDETAGKSEVTAQNISIEAGGAADLSAGVYTAENALDVTSVGDLTADGAQLKAGGVTLQSTLGAVSAAGAELLANTEGNEGVVSVSAATDAALAGATVSAASVDVLAQTGLVLDDARLTALDASSAGLVLKSAAGSLSAERAELVSASDMTISAAGDIDLADSTMDAAGTVSVTSSNGSISAGTATVQGAGKLLWKALYNIAAAGLHIVDELLDLSMRSDYGTLVLDNLQASVTGGASFYSGSSLQMHGASLLSGKLGVESQGLLDLTSSQVVGASGIALLSRDSGVVVDKAWLRAGSLILLASLDEPAPVDGIQIAAQSGVSAKEATFIGSSLSVSTATSGVTMTSSKANVSESVQVVAQTGSVDLSAAKVTAESAAVSAQDEITAQSSVVATTGSDGQSFVSTQGTVDVSEAELSAAKGNVNAQAGTDVVASGASFEAAAGDVTLTAGTGGINVSEATLSAQAGNVSAQAGTDVVASGASFEAGAGDIDLTANTGGIDVSDATLSAQTGNVSAQAGTDVVASGASFEAAAGDIGLTANTGGINVSDAALLAHTGNVSAQAGTDVVASGASFEAGAGDIGLTANTGGIDVSDATLSAQTGNVNAQANTNVVASGASFEAAAGDIDLTANTGDINLAEATGLAAQSIGLEAGGAVELAGREVSVTQDFTVNAGGDVNAQSAAILVSGTSESEGSAPATVSITSESGNIDLAQASIKADASQESSIGSIVIASESGGVDLSDVASVDQASGSEGLTAQEISISAADTLVLGTSAQKFEATAGSITIAAGGLDNNSVAQNSAFAASETLDIAVEGGLNIGSGVQMQASDVSVASGSLNVADKTLIEAENTVALHATDDVRLEGGVQVAASDSVSITAQTGSLALVGAVSIGGDAANGAAQSVEFAAGGSIVQSAGNEETSATGGIRAESLTAAAATGSIVLAPGAANGASSTAPSSDVQNAVASAQLESAGDVHFESTGGDVRVTINETKGGVVDGTTTLTVHEGGLELANGVSSTGDVLVNAASVTGSDLTTDGTLAILAALYDDAVADDTQNGVKFTGTVGGSQVSVYTNAGDISIGSVEATSGHADIYRLSQSETGIVEIGGGASGTTTTIFNGRGDVSFTGAFTGSDSVMIFLGSGGRTNGIGNVQSDLNRVGTVNNASALGSLVTLEMLQNLVQNGFASASAPHAGISAGDLSTAEGMLVSEVIVPYEAFSSPLDRYFFLNLRTDAQASSGTLEDENEKEEEEETALSEGLPGLGKAPVTDSRPVNKEAFEVTL